MRTPMLLGVAALAALVVGAGPAQAAFPGTNGRIAFMSDRDAAPDFEAPAAGERPGRKS
jgi:hypothetical protein